MENKLISLREATYQSGIDQNYLRVLINRKVLHATKVGRDWFITNDDLNQYIQSHSRIKRKAVKIVPRAVVSLKTSSQKELPDHKGAKHSYFLPQETLLTKPKENIAYFLNDGEGQKSLAHPHTYINVGVNVDEKRYEKNAILGKKRYVSSDKALFSRPRLYRYAIGASVIVLLAFVSIFYQDHQRQFSTDTTWPDVFSSISVLDSGGAVDDLLASLQNSLGDQVETAFGVVLNRMDIAKRLAGAFSYSNSSQLFSGIFASVRPFLSQLFLGSGLRETVAPGGNLDFALIAGGNAAPAATSTTTIVQKVEKNTRDIIERVIYVPADSSLLRGDLLQVIEVETNKMRAEIAKFGDELFSVQGNLNNTSRVADSSIHMVSLSQRIDQLSALTVTDGLTVSSGNLVVTNGNVTAQSANFVNLTVTGTCTGCGSGSQTPWTTNIDAAGFNLTNAGSLGFTSFAGTSASATSSLSTGGLAIGTDQFVVQQNSGRIGIGTSSPVQLLSVVGSGYITGGFGVGVATTSSGVIQTSGVINIGGAGTSTFANGVNLSTGCFAISGTCVGSGGSSNWTDQGAYLTPLTITDGILINSATSTITNLLTVNATSTSATTTNLYASGLSVFAGGLLANSATSTITNLTMILATSTSATTTNLFTTNFLSSQATSTSLFAQTAVLSTSTIGNLLTGTVTATSTTASSSFQNLFATNFQGTSLSLSGGLSVAGATVLSTGLTLTCTSCITDANVADGLTISGGTINNTSIGATIPLTAVFTLATSTSATTTNLYVSELAVFAGGLLANSASSTITNLTMILSTSTSATTTNLFATNFLSTNASSTNLSVSGLAVLSGGILLNNATSTITNLTMAYSTSTNATTTHLNISGTIGGANLANCTGVASKLTWLSSTKQFDCEADQTGGSGGGSDFNYIVGAEGIYLSPTSTAVGILTIASSTISRITSLYSTSTSATSTNLFTTNFVSTHATSTSLNISTIASTSLLTINGGTVTYGQSSTSTIPSNALNAFSFATTTTGIPFLSFDTSNYRIGIGTTSPSQLLSVSGNGYFTGGLGVGRSTTTAGVLDVAGSATSTFVGNFGINMLGGCYAINGACQGAVSSVSNSDGTLTISPTTGAVVASLNLGNANTWTGGQTFNLSTSTSATSTNLFAQTAVLSTSTIGNILTGTITATSTSASSSFQNILFTQGQGTGLSLSNLSVSASTSLVRFGSTADSFLGDQNTDLLTINASTTVINNLGFLGNIQIGDSVVDAVSINSGLWNYTNQSTSTLPNDLANAFTFATTTNASGTLAIFTISTGSTTASGQGAVGIGTSSPSGLVKLSVGGDVYLTGGLGIGVATSTDTNLQVQGDTQLTGALSVAGITTFGNTVNFTASTSFTNFGNTGNAFLGNDSADQLTVNATSTFQAGVLFNGGVAIAGAGGLSVTNSVTVLGGLGIGVATSTAGAFQISGGAQIGGALSVTGASTFTGVATLNSPVIQGTVNAGTGLTLPAFTLAGDITGSGSPNLSGLGTIGGGTTTITNLSVTNISTSTFAGGLTVGTTQFVVQRGTGNIGFGLANPTNPFSLLLSATAATGMSLTQSAVSSFSSNRTGILITHSKSAAGDAVTHTGIKVTESVANTSGSQTGGVFGIDIDAKGETAVSSPLDSVYGLRSIARSTVTGSPDGINNLYSLYGSAPTTVNAAVGRAFALYLENPTIGTSTNYSLFAEGPIGINASTTQANALFTVRATSTTANYLQFLDSPTGATRLLVNSSGYLGVATSSFTVPLAVGGNAFIGGDFTGTGTASTSLLTVSNLGNASTQCLQVNNQGVVSTFGGGCGSSSPFGQSWEFLSGITNAISPTSTNIGILVNAGTSTITNLLTINATSTSATSTNLFTTNFLSTNSTSTNLFATNFLSTNSTSTNLFTTNFVSTHATSTSLNISTIASTSLLTINGGLVSYGMNSTSTIPNNLVNAWSIATSTSVDPILSIGTSQSGVGRVGFFTAAPTDLVDIRSNSLNRSLIVRSTTTLNYGFTKVYPGSIVIAPENSVQSGVFTVFGDAGSQNTIFSIDTRTTGGRVSISAEVVVGDDLGVGTTPVSGANLTVLATTSASIPLALSAASGQTADLMRIRDSAGTTLDVFNNIGYLGLGTSTPGALLSLSATSTATLDNRPLFLISTSTASATNTALVIDTNGRIGIGTSSPLQQLSVSGNGYFTGGLGVGRSTTTAGVLDVAGSATSTFVGNFGINMLGGCYAINGACQGAVSSVSNSDGTLTISPTTGAVVASLNLGNANTWIGGQTFNLSTSTSATSTSFFAQTAVLSTSTIGNILTGTITSTSTSASSSFQNILFTQGQGTGLSLTNLTVSASTSLVRFGSTADSFLGDQNTDLLTINASTTVINNLGFLGNIQIGDAQADAVSINSGLWNYANYATSTLLNNRANVFSFATSTLLTPIFSISTSSTTPFGAGAIGIATTVPATLFSVGGSAYIGTSSASTLTIHAGTINYPISSTTTVPIALNAFSFATSTTAVPFLSFDTTNSRIGILNTAPGATLSVNGTASTSLLTISGLGNSATRCLNLTNQGVVGVAAADCGSGGGASFGQSWEFLAGITNAISPTTTNIGILVNAGTSTITNLTMILSTSTSATSTNLFATNFLSTNSTSTNLFATNFFSTNSTSTNLFTTNFVSTHATSTSLNISTIASTSLLTINGGMVTYGKSSTSTILNGLDYAWTIATTTTGNSPIIAINTSGGLATTSIIGGFSVQNGAIEHDFSTGLTSIDNLALGATTFDTDAGMISWADLAVTSNATGTINSYTAQIDGTPILTVYSEAAGSGSVGTTTVGIGTTTPAWKLTVSNNATTTTKAFIGLSDNLASANLKHWTLSSQGGNLYIATSSDAYATSSISRLTLTSGGLVGIGTSTPSSELSIAGNLYLTGGATSTNLYVSALSTLAGGLLTNNATSTITNLVMVNSTTSQATTSYLSVLNNASTSALLVSNLANLIGSTTIGLAGSQTATFDVTNNRLQIGTGAGVAGDPALFVLDTRTGSGDPSSGLNGAMYYNSNSGKFRCYENSAWANCLATATITDSVPFDWCVAQTDSTSFAPGGAFDDFAGNKAAIHMLNATSSRVFCSVHIPKSYSSGPSVVWGGSATTSGRLILDVNSTTTVRQLNGNQGGPVACQYAGVTVESNASSTAAKRLDIVGNASYPINSTSTAISLTLTAGGDLCVIFDRYGADANDTLSDGFFFDYKPYFNFTRAVN